MKAIVMVAALVAGLWASSSALRAEEKNGVSLVVSKKTLDRNDVRASGYYYADRIDRTEGIKATIRNISIKPEPEGEVQWTMIVRKYYSTTLMGSTGSEKLKSLRPSDTVEMVLGAAQITGWNDGYNASKDKLEYQIIVVQEGVEKVRIQSTPGFDALAKRARLTKAGASGDSSMDSEGPVIRTQPAATPKPTATPKPAATPKPVVALPVRPAATVPANPFAAPRATPSPTPKTPADSDAPLDGNKLK